MLHWMTAAASLAGVILNIRGHVACFWIWTVTNLTWAAVDFHHGLPAQGSLQLVYAGLAIWGIHRWTRKPARGGKP